MKALGGTHTGMSRTNNEDSLFYSIDHVGPLPNLFLVADGMGGHNAGEVASGLCCDYCVEYLSQNPDNLDDPAELLRLAVESANDRIFKQSQSTPEQSGMGTTLTMCTIIDSKMYFAHVGDSRLYVIDSLGISRISHDHTVFEELIRLGEITPEMAADRPDKHMLTRAVGTDDYVKADIMAVDIKEAKAIMIASDGLSNMVEEADMFDIYKSESNLESCVEKMINRANQLGGRDNITLILINDLSTKASEV